MNDKVNQSRFKSYEMKSISARKNWQTVQRIQVAAVLIFIITYCLVRNAEARNILKSIITVLMGSLLIQNILFAWKPALFKNKQDKEQIVERCDGDNSRKENFH